MSYNRTKLRKPHKHRVFTDFVQISSEEIQAEPRLNT